MFDDENTCPECGIELTEHDQNENEDGDRICDDCARDLEGIYREAA